MKGKPRSLADIAAHIGADIVGPFASPPGDAHQTQITTLGSIGSAETGALSHLSSASYRKFLGTTKASAVILTAEDAALCPCPGLVVAKPYLAFARASQLFDPQADGFEPSIHPSAVVDSTARIGEGVFIGPNVVVEANAIIGDGAKIQANTSIGDGSVIGAQTTLWPNVTVYPQVTLGDRCSVHSGVVLGAAGFGYTPDEKGHLQAIAQLGGVRIGDDVSIGAGTTIDCGAIDDTVIEDGVKIDNLVQIGHNCKVGAHSLICGCVGLAGSTEIGRHCVLAGGSGVGGKHPVKICDQVVISAKTTVTQSIDKPGIYSGSILATEHATWLRNAVKFSALGELFKRVKKLENENKHE
ncbi:MAG: UDP-3-O-(3-hydroxymyristoyl)glucosamine N-acyltransferase [Gammaproteobacteria bacterium]|jgi:UDP-3-O-[3-hydroxymyristoyl] glucosamine N-acyltransferase